MTTRYDSGLNRYVFQDSAIPVLMTVRQRFTIAQVNAGAAFTNLEAKPGFKHRLVDAYAIAVGGAAAAVTSVDILGTQAAAVVKLVAFLVAGLTQSTVLRAGAATNGVVLADGASFVACDANTPITIGKTGSNVTTATHIDVVLSFQIDE